MHIPRLSGFFLSGLMLCVPFGMSAEKYNISTANNTLLLDATPGAPVKVLHYGSLLGAADIDALDPAKGQDVYPAYGNFPEGESAISAVMPDGNMTLDLALSGKPSSRTNPDGSLLYTFPLRDKVYPVEVDLCYRVWPAEDIIETWSELRNKGSKPVKFTRYDSASLPVRRGDVWLTSFYGSWANEANVCNEPLLPGMRLIQCKDGVRNAHTAHPEVMLSLDGKPREDAGRVIGAALEYTGNYKLRFNTDPSDFHRFFAGINEENSWLTLGKGESFATPALALTYSDRGLGGVSRRFHKWGRNHRLAHGDMVNPILLNSWEGVYFNINEEGMAQMMKDIADMGGELFVMDDGWFGDKFPRNSDNAALGDWTVDVKKLPHGIDGLLDEADRNNIKFGIWIEPEMTNSVSRLYKEHPEYVIQAARRDTVKGRGGTQLVLDMANPKVQDLVFNVVDTLLTRYPRIAYIKWDANAPIMQHGSQYLASDRQSHLYTAYHQGLVKTLERIRAKYPDVMIQDCASGGGRVNWGMLPWFDEFWTSDNTDALQRVRMQYGTSYFFPAMAMGSHISAVPNHTTYRSVPLKFRVDVAMSGRLGMEIQPRDMSKEDKDFCREAIAAYKDIRDVVQLGDQYRLLSPFDNQGAAALMYVSEPKDRAVFFYYRTDNNYGAIMPRPALQGLDPDATYKVKELNRVDDKPLDIEGTVFSGRYLMENGLDIPAVHSLPWGKRVDYASRVILLESVK